MSVGSLPNGATQDLEESVPLNLEAPRFGSGGRLTLLKPEETGNLRAKFAGRQVHEPKRLAELVA